jgi:hypothetical protein
MDLEDSTIFYAFTSIFAKDYFMIYASKLFDYPVAMNRKPTRWVIPSQASIRLFEAERLGLSFLHLCLVSLS